MGVYDQGAGDVVLRILSAGRALGDGIDLSSLARGVETGAECIVVQGGASECDADLLGAGASRGTPTEIEEDWRALLKAREAAGVPLILTSAGGCGVDAIVDQMIELTRKIAPENGEGLRVAAVKSSQDPEALATAWLSGLVDPYEGAVEIDDDALRQCSHIVALAGAEHVAGALETSADVVIVGRSADAAAIAGAAIARGVDAGVAWHAGLVAAAAPLGFAGAVDSCRLLSFDSAGATIECMGAGEGRAADAAAALAGFDISGPAPKFTPGGDLALAQATYLALDLEQLRCEGAEWRPSKPYRSYLEAARPSASAAGADSGRSAFESILNHSRAMLSPWDAFALETIEIAPIGAARCA